MSLEENRQEVRENALPKTISASNNMRWMMNSLRSTAFYADETREAIETKVLPHLTAALALDDTIADLRRSISENIEEATTSLERATGNAAAPLITDTRPDYSSMLQAQEKAGEAVASSGESITSLRTELIQMAGTLGGAFDDFHKLANDISKADHLQGIGNIRGVLEEFLTGTSSPEGEA